MIHSADHWLVDVHQVISPNCNLRPSASEISLLVIHNISLPAGEFGSGYIERLFTNCLDCDAHPSFDDLRDLQVSSHCLIDRAGVITQFVPLNKRAWHAGESEFQGRSNCNDFSIGIELEGTDDCPYTALQYQALQTLCRQILSAYPAITVDRIVGHCDIAPGRKTDPGAAFDWALFRDLLS
ncbi:N-acetylmuramoyl-L-alanine amidase [Oceanicoccus sagamiensis]|uniref:1,6-anhydro-N-acetylmuramyl-L-alanine amidase AmpD n=1 Tax=Oceanicoccus sagamiensis TaxID=716816 RepID=A0A1X9NBU8_9GAMM|nr:N-acetylmuramoyl-L-alanine amidase [Oceanicoccus sagamiensis]